MENKKLNQFAQLLLDTGKTNNAIKFKDTKASVVEVIYPDATTVFQKFDKNAQIEIYDPTPGKEWEPGAEEVSLANMDRETYVATFAPKLKKAGQILIYNPANQPMNALRTIDKKGRSALEETGVHIVYMAFGFIHWKEKGSSEDLRAPILLLPITFTRESLIAPYHVKTTGDDFIVNPTFRYKMKEEYELQLPEYEDEGLLEYVSKVDQVIGALGWTTSLECKIGVFSFLKLNMYRDLLDHQEEILQSPNVRRLLGETVYEAELPPMTAMGCESPLLELHSVVDADSSQMEAIEMAKSGMSFVLQGPPGTGKSQTITNIIAEQLFDGKKVLFVSEKQAALNVVYEKLRKAGLSEFCLELHSHKANKKTVLEEICHTLRENKTLVSQRAEAELCEKEKRLNQLNEYEEALHAKHPATGMSLYDLYNAYLEAVDRTEHSIPVEDSAEHGAVLLKNVREALEQYASYADSVGEDFRTNPWYGYVGTDASYEAQKNIADWIGVIVPAFEELLTLLDELQMTYGIVATTASSVKLTQRLFTLLAALKDENGQVSGGLLKSSSYDHLQQGLMRMRDMARLMLGAESVLTKDFDATVFVLSGEDYSKKLTRQFDNALTRNFSQEYHRLLSNIRLAVSSGKKIGYEEAVYFMNQLAQYQAAKAEYEGLEREIAPMLGALYTGPGSDFEKLTAYVKEMEEVKQRGLDVSSLIQYFSEKGKVSAKEFLDVAVRLKELRDRYSKPLTDLSKGFDLTIVNFGTLSLETLERLLRRLEKQLDQLGNWIHFQKLLFRFRECGSYTFLLQALDAKIPANEMVFAFEKSYYEWWIRRIVSGSEVLLSFSKASQDQAVHIFSDKDKEHFTISKAQIKAVLSGKRPSLDFVAAGSGVQILLREESKKRKQKSIRALLQETGEVVQVLKPCFLMSPLSVSTFLADDSVRFDTVIFDEASQIFPQDAIGAIYRGKQLIVVGDSKQMPPTNFFNASMDSDFADEEEEDITDFESILDLCQTSMPQLRLKWHYRSHYEQLISFSNTYFYDDELISFPSVMQDREGIGVDYHYVPGVFDRKTKTNAEEGKRVVSLVFENIRKYPERSMGVVAFSSSQADLIEKMLLSERQKHPEFEPYFLNPELDPFFIKNLETVQGDERDIIIFSIAYAKGTDGRLLHNFGPINRVGGERRLNVAVSRAKDNVQVVASMHASDLELKESQSKGAMLLKQYLDYAEHGYSALKSLTGAPKEEKVRAVPDYLEQSVADFLLSKGVRVETKVGNSEFRIDLAVKKADSEDYFLAIEADGYGYHSSGNARDRDRLRREVLGRMGWTYYRLWSFEWMNNRKVEEERLLAAVHGKVSADIKEDTKTEAPEEPSFEQEKEARKLVFPMYKMVTDYPQEDTILNNPVLFQQMIRNIAEVEAPVSEEWLLKRLCILFGRSKVTPVVEEAYESRMQGCERLGLERRNGFLYLADNRKYVLRVPRCEEEEREVKYIALEELAAGILTVVRQNIRADRSGVYKHLADQLGYSRMTPAITERMNEAALLLKGMIETEGDEMFLVQK